MTLTFILSLALLAEPAGSGRVEDAIAWILGMSEPRTASIEVSEPHLNEFLSQAALEGRLGPVREISAQLQSGFLEIVASVDMEKVKFGPDSSISALLGDLFSGPQNVKVLADFKGESGVGYFEAREVWLNGYSLPPVAVSFLLDSVGKKFQPPFDPSEPFKLPFEIDRVEVIPGAIRLSR